MVNDNVAQKLWHWDDMLQKGHVINCISVEIITLPEIMV